MLATYWQGMVLGFAMILPLGPQNMMVMTQGIRRQFAIMAASLCALSDALLIYMGVFGGSALLTRSSVLLMLITWCGVVFLSWYGWGMFKTLWSTVQTQWNFTSQPYQRGRVLAMLVAVTWLNPHVYLDTIVILGSFGSQLVIDQRSWFAIGAISASVIWFFSLALLAAWLSPWLRRPAVQRVINLLVACVMWAIAFKLAKGALHQMATDLA